MRNDRQLLALEWFNLELTTSEKSITAWVFGRQMHYSKAYFLTGGRRLHSKQAKSNQCRIRLTEVGYSV